MINKKEFEEIEEMVLKIDEILGEKEDVIFSLRVLLNLLVNYSTMLNNPEKCIRQGFEECMDALKLWRKSKS
jgi:hypothetical protein